MRPVYLVAKLVSNLEYNSEYDYIGIDSGALYCMEHNIPMICAVGDFDSVTSDEKDKLGTYTSLLELPCKKNETDTEIALLQASKLGYSDITLLGGLGGRRDHEFANIRLMMRMNPKFKIEDESNIMEILDTGCHTITKRKKYFSVFALEDTCITTREVAYELTKRTIDENDVYTVSNEVLEDTATIEIHYGKVLLIHSEDSE